MSTVGASNNIAHLHQYSKEVQQQERLLLTKGAQYLINTEMEPDDAPVPLPADQVSLSTEASELGEDTPQITGLKTHQGRECFRLTLLRDLFERFIGKSVPIFSSEDVLAATGPGPGSSEFPAADTEAPAASESLALALEYREVETVSFSTTGNFQTADGHEVGFNLEMNFSRQILAEKALGANFAEAMSQPFNIRYDGFASQITQTSFSFTLACCGRGEEITLVDSPQNEVAKPGGITEELEIEEKTEMAAAEESEAAPVDAEETAASEYATSFFDRLRVWAKDGQEGHRPVMFGVKGVGVMFHERQGMEFTLRKLGHFMNRMAQAIDRFSAYQVPAENTQKISQEA